MSTNFRFDHARLPNGLTVIGEHNPSAQSVAAGYFVNTGSRDEHDGISGVSHFLEHMMFKGTERRSAEDINREFDELGARSNAYTSEEHTVYYGAVLPEQRERLIDLLSDMMRPALREDDFEMEKNVILEEIAMYQDRPNLRVFELGSKRFFGQHPLGNSVLGTPETIGPLSRKQMLDYFRSRYAPNNLVLTLAGAYDWDATLAQVQAATESWEPQQVERAYPELATATGLEQLVDEKLKRVHIGFWAPGPSAQDDMRYPAALLASVLGDSSGSRLYWALVDKGTADAAQMWHDAADRGGAFMGYASTAPERAAEVVATVRSVLTAARSEPPTDEEWERARHKLATALTLSSETPFGRLMSLGNSWIYNGVYQSQDEQLARVMGATREQALELLDQGVFERLFTFSLGPNGVSGD
ncbi:MAG TPA: pitrilysin family protein [Trueperaceae bacterium]